MGSIARSRAPENMVTTLCARERRETVGRLRLNEQDSDAHAGYRPLPAADTRNIASD